MLLNMINVENAAEAVTYMTTVEVAALLRTAPETVRYWRHIRTGPRSFKAGRRVLYKSTDVEQWIEQRYAAGGAA